MATIAKPPATKAPVTTRALAQRVDRELRKSDRRLVKPRGRAALELGPWYVLDLNRNDVVSKGLDVVGLTDLARELEVLQLWERVAA